MVNRLRPPASFDPVTETIPVGSLVLRVHEPMLPSGERNDGTLFNPGFGRPSRFAFFGEPPVPVLYAAQSPEAAVHETILHDAEPGSFIPRVAWMTKTLTAVRTTAEITVAKFHGDGLRRFGLFPADLTDTDMTAYARTVTWAAAAHRAGLAGVSYMCRHYNTSRAWCLFGDRVPAGALRAEPRHAAARMFALPADAEWLASLAAAMRVVIRP